MEVHIITKLKLSPEVTKWKIEAPLQERPDNMIFGFDPGTTNIGISYIHAFNPTVAYLFQVKLKRDKSTENPSTREPEVNK